MKALRICMLAVLAVAPVLCADGTTPAMVPASAVDDNAAGRDSLRDIDPPWYDRDRDSWRRVGVPPEKKPEKSEQDSSIDLEPVFIVAVAALVAVVLGGMVALLLRRRLPDNLPDNEVKSARPAQSNATVLAFVPAAGAADPEAALKAALAAQDWRAATIWIYALTLLALEHAGVLRLDAGKTDRAYVREAARAFSARKPAGAGAGGPDGQTSFTATVNAFSAVYFGHQPADAASVARMQGARQDLLQRLARK